MTVYSDFLKQTLDLDALGGLVSKALGCSCRLTPLDVKCTYPVFRGDTADGSSVFVKVGTSDEWRRTAHLLNEIGSCGLFAKMLTDAPVDYEGHAVFVMEWRASTMVRPEDMNERQAANFVTGCVRLSEALQRATDFTPVAMSPAQPERLYGTLVAYVKRHPLSGRLLDSLVDIPLERRLYDASRLAVVHGDFHAKNFGFSGNRLASVYDFDQLTQGLACADFVNALVERFSCLSLSDEVRRRLSKMTHRLTSETPWPREDMITACNMLRLRFAVRRIEKHPLAPWVAFDISRRDRKIVEFLACLAK